MLEPGRRGHGKTRWHQRDQVFEQQNVFGKMVAQDIFTLRHVRVAIRHPTGQPTEKSTPNSNVCNMLLVFYISSTCIPASLSPKHPRELLRYSLQYPPVRRVLDFVENFLVVCWLELGLHDSVAELVLWFSSVPEGCRRRSPGSPTFFAYWLSSSASRGRAWFSCSAGVADCMRLARTSWS